MKELIQLKNLIAETTDYLKSVFHFKNSSIEVYHQRWKSLEAFMIANSISVYDRDVERKYFLKEYGTRTLKELSRWEKRKYYTIWALTQFLENGKIPLKHRQETVKLVLEGSIGETMTDFVKARSSKNSHSSAHTLRIQKILFDFLTFCNESRVAGPEELTVYIVLKYFQRAPVKDYLVPYTLRFYFRYLFEKGILPINYASRIPKLKKVDSPKLPTTYREDEVEKLIDSIDISSKAGIRTLAIVLLSARLGMRISDIYNLKFTDINWNADSISFCQTKTNVPHEALLPVDVGNAIFDYIHEARPASDEPFVFVRNRPPHVQCTVPCSMTWIVSKSFKESGIKLNGRKHGPHSLRHSFAQRLLNAGVAIDVIAALLGHAGLASVKVYTRVNFKAMLECPLEVAQVDNEFYNQKGGSFYAA